MDVSQKFTEVLGMRRGVHLHHAPPNIYFSLHSNIFERLLAELVLTQGLATSGDWTARGTSGEDAVHA